VFFGKKALENGPIYLWIRQSATRFGNKGKTGLATGGGQDIDIATVVLYSTSWNNEQQKVYYVQVCLAGGGSTPRAPIIRSLIGRRVPNGMRDAGTARAWGGQEAGRARRYQAYSGVVTEWRRGGKRGMGS
jgi:hypothetical protein